MMLWCIYHMSFSRVGVWNVFFGGCVVCFGALVLGVVEMGDKICVLRKE